MRQIEIKLIFNVFESGAETGEQELKNMIKEAIRPVLVDPRLKSCGINLDRKSSKITLVEVEKW